MPSCGCGCVGIWRYEAELPCAVRGGGVRGAVGGTGWLLHHHGLHPRVLASRPPWCLTMLGSNWMDRGDAFFDYCSLHHQNSLTCLFMLRSENIVPVTLYNNNVSAVCWHNKTKATQIALYNRIPISHCCLPESHWEETRTFYSQTILYIVLIGLMDCLRECIRWTRIVGTSLIIPIILVSANLLLHLLEDQGTFSSS